MNRIPRYHINRRELFHFGGIALVLAACQNGQLPALPVKVDVTTSGGLATLLDTVNSIASKAGSAVAVLPPSVRATAISWLAKLQSAAGSINVAKTIVDAQPYVTGFQAAWAELQPILASVSGTPVVGSSGATTTVGKIVDAVETVLPIALKIAGLVAMFARSRPTGMSVAEAQAILHS